MSRRETAWRSDELAIWPPVTTLQAGSASNRVTGGLYFVVMSVDVAAVQEALKAEGLDGWLLYDFHGSNPIAARLAGIGERGGHLATRRWFYLVPSSGEPRGLVHAIERHNLDHLPGPKSVYAGRVQLE